MNITLVALLAAYASMSSPTGEEHSPVSALGAESTSSSRAPRWLLQLGAGSGSVPGSSAEWLGVSAPAVLTVGAGRELPEVLPGLEAFADATLVEGGSSELLSARLFLASVGALYAWPQAVLRYFAPYGRAGLSMGVLTVDASGAEGRELIPGLEVAVGVRLQGVGSQRRRPFAFIDAGYAARLPRAVEVRGESTDEEPLRVRSVRLGDAKLSGINVVVGAGLTF